MAEICTFCRILRLHLNPEGTEAWRDRISSRNKKDELLYEDDLCVIFADLKEEATAHYQCIPKRHIKNYSKL